MKIRQMMVIWMPVGFIPLGSCSGPTCPRTSSHKSSHARGGILHKVARGASEAFSSCALLRNEMRA